MDTLDGAHIFVTGGGSGIGLGFVQAAAAEGAKLSIADIRQDHLDHARAIAGQEGWADRAFFTLLDIADRQGMADALDAAIAAQGPLRVMVNNAGVGVAGPLTDAVYADWDWAISVNIGGIVNGVMEAMQRIRSHGLGGHILNTASMGALLPARPTRGLYAPTKAAVITLSEHLRLDLADLGIGVSVLCPGPVVTNIRESGVARPAALREGSAFVQLEAAAAAATGPVEISPGLGWLEPITVGRMMVDAILTNQLYILTHPSFLPMIKARHAAIEEAATHYASFVE